MNKKTKLGWAFAALVATLVGGVGGASAYQDRATVAPFPDEVVWDDTGVTPAGVILRGRLSTSGRNNSVWTSHTSGSGLLAHDVVMFWGCSNGFADGVVGTFTTSSIFTPKFSRNCPLGTTSTGAAAAIDDL
jgi:hypothetical protein